MVLIMFALDKQMIVRLKVIRKCFLSTCSFYHHFSKHITWKKKKKKAKISFLLFFQYDHRLLSQPDTRQLKIKTSQAYRIVKNKVLWAISWNIFITVFWLYNLLLSSDHENPCVVTKDFLDKSYLEECPGVSLLIWPVFPEFLQTHSPAHCSLTKSEKH